MKLQPTTFGAAVIAAVASARSDGASNNLTPAGTVHAMHHLDNLDWRPAPAIFPPGAMYAVVQGNPSVPGEIFTVRLRFPHGYVLAPHTHPADEHVTVLRGVFGVGLGGVFSAGSLTLLQPGDFLTAPKNTPHFASAQGITEVQVHAIGPFRLRFVNPTDEPNTI